MMFIRLWFLLITGIFARERNYPWNSAIYQNIDRRGYGDLSPEVHLLLKQGLKIGYLPPTKYNCKFVFPVIKFVIWKNYLKPQIAWLISAIHCLVLKLVKNPLPGVEKKMSI